MSERLDRHGYRLVKTAEDFLTSGRDEMRDRFLRLVAEAGEIRREEHREHYRLLLETLEHDSDTLRRFARKVAGGRAVARHRDTSWARPTAPLREYVSADVSVGGRVDALRFARDTPCPDLRVIMNAELGLEEAEALFDQVLDALYPEDDGPDDR